MLVNRISLRSRAGPDLLHCEAADSNFRVYNLSKLVEMGKIWVFSSLRSPFLVKIPFPRQRKMLTCWILFLFTSLSSALQEILQHLCVLFIPCVNGVQYHQTCCLDKQQGFADCVSVIFSFLAVFDFFQFVGMSILSVQVWTTLGFICLHSLLQQLMGSCLSQSPQKRVADSPACRGTGRKPQPEFKQTVLRERRLLPECRQGSGGRWVRHCLRLCLYLCHTLNKSNPDLYKTQSQALKHGLSGSHCAKLWANKRVGVCRKVAASESGSRQRSSHEDASAARIFPRRPLSPAPGDGSAPSRHWLLAASLRVFPLFLLS